MPAPAHAPPHPFRQAFEACGFRCAEWLVPRLPRPVFLGLIRVLAPLAWLLDVSGRRVTTANLQAALGPLPDGEIRRLGRRAYHALCRMFLDLLRTPLLTGDRWKRWIHHEDRADLPALAASGKGMIFVCLHYGSFEWNNLLLSRLGCFPMVVTQESKNPAITERLAALRAQGGSLPITQERSVLRMFKQLKKGQPVGLLADLTMHPAEPSVVIETFGGLKMCVNMLAAELHLRTGAPIVALSCRPQPDGTARILIHPPLAVPGGADARAITQALWDLLEPEIREQPEHWLWAYKHWRYRPARPGGMAYPFYANPSGAFERLLAKQSAPGGNGPDPAGKP